MAKASTVTTIHLIANAHLDPVWLWDWREGLNEGISTVRAMLDVMDEDPGFTFIRGEAAIYSHLERHDPKTFARVRRYVKADRWDVVGGTWIQPDTNLTGSETMARHFAHGQAYFRARFGRAPTVAWAADSFGHSAGLPEVLAQAGIDSFAFTRGLPEHLAEPAFWWEGAGGSRILGYRPAVGGYCSERDELPRRLDALLARSATSRLANRGLFYGLGNHGGGATRRHLADIRAWAERHPEVRVVHSGLHRLFAALRAELRVLGDDALPLHRGEMNFCLRGCYASVAKFKFPYRRAEAQVAATERSDAVIAAALGRRPADCSQLWQDVLFNSFHDILPGSSIERAMDDQIAWLGGTRHRCQQTTLDAINALAARVDTSVPVVGPDHPTAVPVLVWNPHPHPFVGHVEIEANLDHRPIWSYTDRVDQLPVQVLGSDGEPLPHQIIDTEHSAMPAFAWRKRALVPIELPPMGWQVLTIGWVEGAASPPITDGVASGDGWIANQRWRVEAAPGADSIRVSRDGESAFGDAGLSFATVEDPFGSWGGMGEERASFTDWRERARWRVARVIMRERGPERAALWVRLEAGASWLELTFTVARGRDAVDVSARLLWNERSARLRMIMPAGDDAEFDVLGGSARRGPCGEVPGGRWVRVHAPAGGFGFASDGLYSFACENGALIATIARATRYANDVVTAPDAAPWLPAVDSGELRFIFLFAPGDAHLPRRARELESPPIAQTVPATARTRASRERSGSLAELRPTSLALLALKGADDGRGLVLRVQETSGAPATAELVLFGSRIRLGRVEGHRIATWRLRRGKRGWTAVRSDIQERAEKAPDSKRRPPPEHRSVRKSRS